MTNSKKKISKKIIFKIIAGLVCFCECILYFIITLILGWQNFGGYLPVMLLFGLLAITWKKISGLGKSEKRKIDKQLIIKADNIEKKKIENTENIKNQKVKNKKKKYLYLAVLSVIFGIIGGYSWLSTASIVSIVCGHIALYKIKNKPKIYAGKRLAIAGLILGYLGFGLALYSGFLNAVLKLKISELLSDPKVLNRTGIEWFNPTDITDFPIIIDFPNDYPDPNLKSGSDQRKGRTLKIWAYSTTNVKNGEIAFDGPGFKQFIYAITECPQQLGCNLDEEVGDFVNQQESRGGKIYRNEKFAEGNSVIADVMFTREIEGEIGFFKNTFLLHDGYMFSAGVQVQQVEDLLSQKVLDFFLSMRINDNSKKMSFIIIHLVIFRV